jgi:Leucine-rich repeat (LRR) protein
MGKTIQPHRKRTAIPGDLVQGTVEYLAGVRDVLQCRCVCSLWQRAVADAVGYINDRKWTNLDLQRLSAEHLARHFIQAPTQRTTPFFATLVVRFALACLWDRLEMLCWSYFSDLDSAPQVLPLQILGANDRLTTLSLGGPFLRNVELLQGFTALTALSIFGQRGMDGAEFFGAIAHIRSLAHLHLPECRVNIDADALRRCENLRTLDLSESEMIDDSVAAALVLIPTLEILVLRCCPNLKTIAKIANTADAESVSSDGSRARVPGSLTRIDLTHTNITDASALADCRELRNIGLWSCPITDGTLVALARLPDLQELRLNSCTNIRNAGVALRHCSALRELFLTAIPLQEADLRGLEEIATLETLDLQGTKVCNVDCLQRCPRLRSLNLQSTLMTNAALAAVARIATLECLFLGSCSQVDDPSALGDCPALRRLDLNFTRVVHVDALARIKTLTSVSLNYCTKLASVTALSRCKGLRELSVSHTPAAAAEDLFEAFAQLPSLQLDASK